MMPKAVGFKRCACPQCFLLAGSRHLPACFEPQSELLNSFHVLYMEPSYIWVLDSTPGGDTYQLAIAMLSTAWSKSFFGSQDPQMVYMGVTVLRTMP